MQLSKSGSPMFHLRWFQVWGPSKCGCRSLGCSNGEVKSTSLEGGGRGGLQLGLSLSLVAEVMGS